MSENDYNGANWVHFGIERGSIGRDSGTVLKDKVRMPFVRDVLRLACLKAQSPEDVICLTKPDTRAYPNLGEKLLKSTPCYAHRTVMLNGQPTFHPAVDLFAFTKKWWQEHQDEMPDMVMGRDWMWEQVLVQILKRHGAVELPFAVYRVEKEEE